MSNLSNHSPANSPDSACLLVTWRFNHQSRLELHQNSGFRVPFPANWAIRTNQTETVAFRPPPNPPRGMQKASEHGTQSSATDEVPSFVLSAFPRVPGAAGVFPVGMRFFQLADGRPPNAVSHSSISEGLRARLVTGRVRGRGGLD